jgi:hypothetical protein
MSFADLQRLFALYIRPRATMAAIIDEGSFLFGAIAVFVVSILVQVPVSVAFWTGVTRGLTVTEDGRTLSMEEAGKEAVEAAKRRAEHPDVEDEPPGGLRGFIALYSGLQAFSTLLAVAGLAILYVPAVIFLMTLLDRRTGSFGVALSRDYGMLAPCLLSSWAAAHLPLSLVGIGLAILLPTSGLTILICTMGIFLAGGLLFVVLGALAVRLVYGVGFGKSLVPVVAAAALLPLSGYLSILASPFALYFAWMYLRGDITAIQSVIGSRRSFKRALEAATINPRDAEAHYQLGLIHQHRRQYKEAIDRFQKAVEIDPRELDAHYQLGRIAREQGRYAEAIQHFEPVVARDPRHARHEIWREVGATYVEAGDFAAARPALERYVDHRAYDPEGLFWLGLTLKKLGEAKAAQEMRERCVEASRTAPDYRKSELRHWRSRAQKEI